jgi:apolipoprotein N-acyltransferase
VPRRLALALLTGALLAALYPPFGLRWFAPVALTPLLIALGGEFRPAGRFALGYVAGLVLWGGVCWWIAPVLEVHGGMGAFGGWGSFVLFCLLKSIHYGVFGLLAGVLIRHWYGPPAAALLWAILERSQEPLTLFGWLMLGDAAIEMPLPLRLAPFAGVYGLSFLFALTASSFAVIFLSQPRQRATWALLSLLPSFLPPLPAGIAPTAHAALVQPDLAAEMDWTAESYAAAKSDLVALSESAAAQGPLDLIVWPETPGPVFYGSDADLRSRVAALSAKTGAPVLLGSIWRDAAGAPFNSAILAPAGIRYDKVFLVPFGEYVPSLFSFVNQVSDEVGAYTPGTAVKTMPLLQTRIGTFICYESAVSHHVRDFARAGAALFVNISNDGYFFRTPAREQHLQLVRMRAVENRRWVLRATNNGITAVIDPAGVIRDRIPGFTPSVLRAGFAFENRQTVFTRHGDWFVLIAALLVLIALFASQRPHFTTPAKSAPRR